MFAPPGQCTQCRCNVWGFKACTLPDIMCMDTHSPTLSHSNRDSILRDLYVEKHINTSIFRHTPRYLFIFHSHTTISSPIILGIPHLRRSTDTPTMSRELVMHACSYSLIHKTTPYAESQHNTLYSARIKLMQNLNGKTA